MRIFWFIFYSLLSCRRIKNKRDPFDSATFCRNPAKTIRYSARIRPYSANFCRNPATWKLSAIFSNFPPWKNRKFPLYNPI